MELEMSPLVAARKTLERLGYTYHGGEQWKPPLGEIPLRLSEEALAESKWMQFLNLRQQAIKELYSNGMNVNEIARVMSLTGSQVKIIQQQEQGQHARPPIEDDYDWKPGRDL